MNAALKGSCLVGIGIFVAFSGRPARAAEGPLLVVVEAPPALDADAAEIRRAIGVELRRRDHRPDEAECRTTWTRTDRRVRPRSNRDVASHERCHADRPRYPGTDRPGRAAARHRLAGRESRPRPGHADRRGGVRRNNAPDDNSVNRASPGDRAAPAAVTDGDRQRPLFRQLRSRRPRRDRHDNRENRSSRKPEWSLSAGRSRSRTVRPPISPEYHRSKRELMFGTAWHLDVQRRSGKNGFLLGAALSGTNGDFAPEGIGMLVFVGSASRRGRWSFEATVGAGVELGERACPLCDRDPLERQRLSEHRDAARRGSTWPSCRRGRRGGASAVAVGGRRRSPRGASVDHLDLTTSFLTTTIGLRYNLQ